MPYQVFVLGLDEENRAVLDGLPNAHEYAFHRLLTFEELQCREDIPVQSLLDEARRELDAFEGPIDAIVGYWDFPVSSMVAILCEDYGLPSPSLRSKLVCEHKYWARRAQSAVTDAHPRYEAVDPFADDAAVSIGLEYPFWIKPIKGYSSELARKVGGEAELAEALASIRERVGRVGRPFEHVLSLVDLPEEIASLGGNACIAEEEVRGAQATVEGYARDGDVAVYGIVDSVRYPDSPCFLRYELPSRLPQSVQFEMADIARVVIKEIGLSHSTFNIEFFWDPDTDRLAVLEINPRHSQSHAWLFWQVYGLPNHELMLDLALDRPVRLPRGRGNYERAAKCFLRRFEDGVVTRVPSAEEIRALQRRLPGVLVFPEVRVGERLSDLVDQDSYSFKLAHLSIGAADADELDEKYRRAVELLRFEFAEP